MRPRAATLLACVGAFLAIAAGGCRRPTHADNARFEAPEFQNACASDGDCLVSGCSSEVCAAEVVPTTCEIIEFPPGGDCGCVDQLCQWYVEEGNPRLPEFSDVEDG